MSDDSPLCIITLPDAELPDEAIAALAALLLDAIETERGN